MEVVLGASDRVNITSLMHDTRLCQDVKMTTLARNLLKYKYKICYDVKTDAHDICLVKRPDTRSFIATGL